MELASARYEVKIDADAPRVANVKCLLTPKADSNIEKWSKAVAIIHEAILVLKTCTMDMLGKFEI